MSHHLKSLVALAVVSGLALAVGHALPRPGRQGGDMLDAVAVVQRRSPRFLVTERAPPANWVRTGALYLCRTPRTAEDVEALCKDPGRQDPRWAGVVCFRGTSDPHQLGFPWLSGGADCFLHYGEFVVFGDPEVVLEVRALLAAEGFRPAHDPDEGARGLAR